MSAAVENTPAAAGEGELEEKVASLDISQKQTSSVPELPRDRPEGPIKTPFLDPVPSAKPRERPALTADQEAKFEEVLATAKSWKEIPSTKGKGGLSLKKRSCG